ncbi:MAG: hypothetical protein GX444_01760 [Myxococcales bacterium]|nr:hypothetical protein [Myxococcales bacterium]
MKRMLVISLTVLLLTAGFALAAEQQSVNAGFGSATLNGLFKAGFNYYVGDETLGADKDGNPQAMDNGKDMEFTVNYFQLGVNGWVVDKHVTYLATMTADTTAGSVSLLDLKLGFLYIPYTGIYVGRIKPDMTYHGTINSGTFKTIEMPLMNRNIFGRQRQTGLNLNLDTKYLAANLGVYNGRQYTPALIAPGGTDPVGNVDYLDQNTGKDIHFGLIGKPPVEGLNIRANLWYGTPLDANEVKDGELTNHNVSVMFLNGGVDYLAPFGLTLIGELFYGTYAWDSKDPATNFEDDRADDTYELTTMSYYLMAGYNFGPVFEVPVEIVARYDYLDPDTLNDKEKHPASEQDALTDIVGGVNYYIKGYNAMLSLNYIYRGEEWEKVLTKKGDDDQTGIANDQLKLQAQVMF